MDLVVAVVRQRQTSWLGKDIVVGLQEPLEHGWLIATNEIEVARGLHIMASGADAAPEDPATHMPKGHT